MRKINKSVENPIDNLILTMIESLLDPMYKLGITANMLTLMGLLLRLWSLSGLFSGDKIAFLIGGILGYVFDCIDGHYARKYKMTSKFGDFFDHSSDILFQAGLIYYLCCFSDLKDSCAFWPVIILYILFGIALNVHMGCQQKIYNGKAESLNCLISLCPNVDWINITKYFGCGTFMTFSILLGMVF